MEWKWSALFRDEDSLRSELLISILMQPTSVSMYKNILGESDIIHASFFFRLFTLEEQLQLSIKVVGILRRRKGSIMLGRQLGSARPPIAKIGGRRAL